MVTIWGKSECNEIMSFFILYIKNGVCSQFQNKV